MPEFRLPEHLTFNRALIEDPAGYLRQLIAMFSLPFSRLALVTALFATACGGASSESFDLAAVRQEIAALNEQFTQAHLTGDVALIDAMFTADAVSHPPGTASVRGPQALHDFTVAYIALGISEFREESSEFYGNAELVVDAGTYVVTFGPDYVTERGKYLNVWRNVNGSWKIQSNIWNTDAVTP